MKWQSKRQLIIWSILIGAFLLVTAASAVPITVIGEGRASVPADTAIITVSVQSGHENVTLAEEQATEMLDEVMQAVKAAGVKDDEILPGRSSGVSSFQSESRISHKVNNSTVWENSTQKASSLERSTTLRLRGTDSSRIDRVLEAARTAGGEAQLTGYGLSNSTQAAGAARKNAVINARENAEEMARAYGVALGDLLEVSDYGYPAMQEDSSANSLQAAMVEVVAYVVATYEMKI